MKRPRTSEGEELEQPKRVPRRGAGRLELKGVYAAPSPVHGWGVFTDRSFERGERVQQAPVRWLPEDVDLPENLTNDVFERRNEKGTRRFLAYGLGSLTNHSDTPNCRYAIRRKSHAFGGMPVLNFYALRTLAQNEEVTISYGDEYFQTRPHIKKKAG